MKYAENISWTDAPCSMSETKCLGILKKYTDREKTKTIPALLLDKCYMTSGQKLHLH